MTLAVGFWLPTLALRVPTRVRPCGIFGGQIYTAAGYVRMLQFTLPIIPPTAPHSPSSIIRGWCSGPIIAAVASGLSLSSPEQVQNDTDLQSSFPPAINHANNWDMA
jgi:hypothetical protein